MHGGHYKLTPVSTESHRAPSTQNFHWGCSLAHGSAAGQLRDPSSPSWDGKASAACAPGEGAWGRSRCYHGTLGSCSVLVCRTWLSGRFSSCCGPGRASLGSWVGGDVELGCSLQTSPSS